MRAKAKNIIHEMHEERFKHNCYVRVHYFINEGKKTVACKFEPFTTLDDPYSFPWESVDYYDFSTPGIRRQFFGHCEENGYSFIGKAVCSDPDEFDAEFGKKLAYDKATFKMLDAKQRFLNEMKKFCMEVINRISAEEETTYEINKKCQERFEKKIKETM